MGSACSTRSVDSRKYKRSSASSISFTHFKRDDADEVLEKAPTGYYLFSKDAAGEQFLSVSYGNYVCHHPIFRQGVLLMIGGEVFVNISQVLDFYKRNPLGTTTLTKQFTENGTSPTDPIRPPEVIRRSEKPRPEPTLPQPSRPPHPQQSRPRPAPEKVHSTAINNNGNSTGNTVFVNGNAVEQEKEERAKEKIFPEVSSADEKEHLFGDEPIPILPAPTGIRPPPLFQRFSLLFEEFLDPFNTTDMILDPKQLLFQLYKGNPRLQYTPRVNTLKIIVTGQVDTYEERSYFLTHYVDKLQEWSHSRDYYLEYIDLMLDHDKLDLQNNGTWLHEKLGEDVSKEIKRCTDGKIPYLLLVYTGHEYGPVRIPEMFRDKDFENLIENINKQDAHVINRCYVKDENSIPCSYVLNENFKTDHTKRKMLADIFKRFTLLEEFPDNLWAYFIPARDLHTKTVLKNATPFVMFINRSFYDINDYKEHARYDDGFEKSQLQHFWRKSKDFYDHCLLNNNLDEDDQFVTYETTFACFVDQSKITQHCQNLCGIVLERIKSSIQSMEIMLESKMVNDLDYDEVLYHVLTAKEILNDSTVHEETFCAMKKYIEDTSPLTLVVHGEPCCGKSSLLSRATTYAFEYFNGLCCIVCRHIGHTPDSSSLSLLLRSICLQLSYAYGTDPNAIPNGISSLIDHFLMLLELATDSLPLVVILDSLDLLSDGSTNDEELIYSLLTNELPQFVRMIVSVGSSQLQKIESDFVVDLAHPNFTESCAFQYLDHMLVEKDRTLNHFQKDLVTNMISTNHEPVFIRLLINEIAEWKSTSKPTISLDSVKDSLEQFVRPKKKSRLCSNAISAFVYAVTLHRMGIPRITLLRFLQHFLQQDYDKVEVQTLLQTILTRWSCLCETKKITGLEFVRVKDNVIYELLLAKSHDSNEKSQYCECMREVFRFIYEEYLSSRGKVSLVKRKLQLVQLSFYHRVLLQYDSVCDDVKECFALNFDFLCEKLTCFSFCHISQDIQQTKKAYPTDYEISALSEMIELSKDALHQDSTQFPLQVVCRLNGIAQQANEEGKKSKFLQRMVEKCKEHCEVLKPSSACLVVPKCICNRDKDDQMAWKEKDLKLMFVKEGHTDFIGWSGGQESIFFYNKNCELLRAVSFKGLSRVLITLKGKLVIETNLGSNVLFDTDVEQSIFSIHENYDVLAGNHFDKVILWSRSNMRVVKVLDTISHTEAWRYESKVPFNYVCCCEDGSTMLCFSDYSKEQNDRAEDEEKTEDVEQIDVLDLKNFCKVATITLPTEASFSKLSMLSEDGQYFVRKTEPDMNLLVWNVRSGKLLYEIKPNCCQIVKLCICSRGKNIVTVSTDASIRVFSLNNGALIHTLTKSVKSIRMDDQHCISLSADGTIVIYYVKSNFYPSFIAVWNVKTGKRLASLTADFYGLNYQISPDCDYILSNFPRGLVKFNLKSTEH